MAARRLSAQAILNPSIKALWMRCKRLWGMIAGDVAGDVVPSGSKLGCFALSEPGNGSDAGAAQVTLVA
jgi:hypothetical protein